MLGQGGTNMEIELDDQAVLEYAEVKDHKVDRNDFFGFTEIRVDKEEDRFDDGEGNDCSKEFDNYGHLKKSRTYVDNVIKVLNKTMQTDCKKANARHEELEVLIQEFEKALEIKFPNEVKDVRQKK